MHTGARRDVGAAILAGGRSRRMGTNKALLRLKRDGPTIIEEVIARLTAAGLPPFSLVTDSPDSYAWLGIPMFSDDIEGAGVLGGILTALTHSPYSRNLVVGCDMPFLEPALLGYMTDLPCTSDVLAPRWADGAGHTLRTEPLHSIYSASCIEPIRGRISRELLRASDLWQDLRVQYVEEPQIRQLDPYLLSFRNINTPEEWRDASQI